ncbi:MAG: rod shape-determining protein MreD [Verrucomicrobia bacterium]|nr:rod shape-determining protein MreD [Verrucomicrobiota bacterium]
MNFLIIATTALLLTALQARLPTAWWIGGFRFEFLPALVAYGALTFRRRRWAVVLAVAAGFLQDALSAGPFGNTGAAYALAALLLVTLGRAFDRDSLWMQMLAGAIASAGASLAAIAVIGGQNAALKLLLLAAVSAVIAPFLFFVLDFARWRSRPA